MVNPLETLNITNTLEITQEQFVSLANKTLAIPDLIALFLIMVLIFLFIPMLLKKNVKYIWIWVLCVILSMIVLIILSIAPNFIFNITEKIGGLFKF